MSEIIDFESVMRDQMIVTSGRINPSTVKMLVDMGFRITKQSAAPTPPQPIYDEAKERELFEAFYSERAKTLPLPLGSPIRYGGGQYVNDFALFGWLVWLKCAQSRAKSGEVDHE